MLAVTSYLSTDIAAVPLLWIVPLALYLLTFVAGVRLGTRRRPRASRAAPCRCSSCRSRCFMIAQIRASASLVIVRCTWSAFVIAALQLPRRAGAGPARAAHLTEFYFWISFGGMLGGLFNTLVAPLLFNGIVEYPLVLLLALPVRSGALFAGSLAAAPLRRRRRSRRSSSPC